MKLFEIISLHKKTFLLFILVVIFISLRSPGIDLPYHQDEFKAAVALAGGSVEAGNFFLHPPLTALSLRFGNTIFGNDHLRLLPLLFSVFSFFIFYAVMKRRGGAHTALWTLFLFALCFYSILASLMIDVDGAILPFFFLVSLYFYDKWRTSNEHEKQSWFLVFLFSLFIGFLIKLSFVIILGVFLIDFLTENSQRIKKKEVIYGIVGLAGFFIALCIAIISIRFLYPEFNLSQMISHALYFFHLSDRNYTQVMVQGVKAIYYLSPILLIPLLFSSKESLEKNRVFYIYLFLAFVFYFILFDFSRGALDKYLMFSIVPLCAIVGSIISDTFSLQKASANRYLPVSLIAGISISMILFAVQFIPQHTLPLYPKEEWFKVVLHFKWNFLNPFNGGSGPMGFYVSFLFIGLTFAVSTIIGIVGFIKKEWRQGALVMILMISVTYWAVLAEELLYGQVNGSATKVMHQAVTFIQTTDTIPGVITYNDIGAFELSKEGKYMGRFYATPELENAHEKRFIDHTRNGGGYFLIVDIPNINKQSLYEKFFSKCKTVFNSRSGKIEANVYSCRIL